MKATFNISVILVLTLTLMACNKFVSINPSNQLITSEDVFSNDYTAISAVDGIYTQLRAANPATFNGSISVYAGLSADDIYNTAASTLYDPFFQNKIPSNNATISSTFWTGPYNIIYRTNAVIEGLEKSSGVTTATKYQLLGEVKVVRALCYFYLVNLLGDVPLVITTDYQSNSLMGRTPAAQVYQQITNDLISAQSLLTNAYPSTGKSRPNAMTATALLARVYLYQKDWTNAAAQSSVIINSNLYSLVADLTKVFLINSSETIWEINSPSELRNAAEGSTFIPTSATAKPAFAINSYLLNAFEIGDKRKTSWLGSNTVSGTTYYYPYKYKNRTTTSITEYDIVFRLDEQYLIRAEAEAQLNQLPQSISDLNVIRTRAGLTAVSNLLSQAQCLAADYQERRVELFAEWGHRWLDLKREGTINQVLGTEKTGWLPYEALYPIPYQQTLYNSNLIQNPSY